jgi:hypothetical protein
MQLGRCSILSDSSNMLFFLFFCLQDIEIQVETGFVVKSELEDLVVPLIS